MHGYRCARLRRINDIGSKDLLNRPIYTVLNTRNLDMILQLKYMPIVIISGQIRLE